MDKDSSFSSSALEPARQPITVCCRVRPPPLTPASARSERLFGRCVRLDDHTPTQVTAVCSRAAVASASSSSRPSTARILPRSPSTAVDNAQCFTPKSSQWLEVYDFTFTHVFSERATQEDAYERVGRPVVEDVLKGYNGSVLVYGQTGSGKTYTMFGPSDMEYPNFSKVLIPPLETCHTASFELSPLTVVCKDSSSSFDAKSPLETSPCDTDSYFNPSFTAVTSSQGIAVRAMETVFKTIERAPKEMRYQVEVSLLEVYMERVRDLLAGGCGRPTAADSLKLREDVGNGSFYVEGCLTVAVTSIEESMKLVGGGLKRRMVGQTAMNDTSSRSHCLLSVVVRSTNCASGEERVGRLALVDLAGSEKVSKTKSMGQQLEEAKQINKSLTTLSLVIQALSTNSAHIPYRNSVLTKLLKESLGGNARTSMVVCCSPEIDNAAETLSTLRFGALATKVVNRMVVNKNASVDELKTKLEAARAEIHRLNKLVERKDGTGLFAAKPSAESVNSSEPAPAAIPASPSSRSGIKSSDRTVEPRRGSGMPPPHSVSRETSLTSATLDTLLNERVQELENQKWEERMRGLEEELANADETMISLMMERDSYKEQRASYAEECSIWEEEYGAVQQQLRARNAEVKTYRRHLQTQEKELLSLVNQLEAQWKLMCVARVEWEAEEERGVHPQGDSHSPLSASNSKDTYSHQPRKKEMHSRSTSTSFLHSSPVPPMSSSKGPDSPAETWMSVKSAESPFDGSAAKTRILTSSPLTPRNETKGKGPRRPGEEEPDPVPPMLHQCLEAEGGRTGAHRSGTGNQRHRSAQTSEHRLFLANVSLLSDEDIVVSALQTERDGVPSISYMRASLKGSEDGAWEPSSTTTEESAGFGQHSHGTGDGQRLQPFVVPVEGGRTTLPTPIQSPEERTSANHTPVSPAQPPDVFHTPVFSTRYQGNSGVGCGHGGATKATSDSTSTDTLPPPADQEAKVKLLEHHVELLQEAVAQERRENASLRVILAGEERWRKLYACLPEGDAALHAYQPRLKSRDASERDVRVAVDKPPEASFSSGNSGARRGASR